MSFNIMKCRHCYTELSQIFIDLGFAPPSNSYLQIEELSRPEKYFPLRVKVCEKCWLVQTEDYVNASDLFNSQYAYFSSTSTQWLEHAKKYSIEITHKLQLNKQSLVIEIASNDGYLLRNFLALGIPCIGIEPTSSTADEAEKIGIKVIREFFCDDVANRLSSLNKQADLIIANNVYAHVPDINEFTRAMKSLLKMGGTVTLEFPHLQNLINNNQFDTIYHEHFSYLSLFTVVNIFKESGLRVWDVEELVTHGGSLRIFGCHVEDGRVETPRVIRVLEKENKYGLQSLLTYQEFHYKAEKVKNDFLIFLIEAKQSGKSVVGYGAAAKGNTLINYAGIKKDLLPYIVDEAKAKQNKYMPGSHIPILSTEILYQNRPDFLIILPWNIADEVKLAHKELGKLGTKFVTLVPNVNIS